MSCARIPATTSQLACNCEFARGSASDPNPLLHLSGEVPEDSQQQMAQAESMINNQVVDMKDSLRAGDGVALTTGARRRVTAAFERRLQEMVTHPWFGYRLSYRRVLYVQTRLLDRPSSVGRDRGISRLPGSMSRRDFL